MRGAVPASVSLTLLLLLAGGAGEGQGWRAAASAAAPGAEVDVEDFGATADGKTECSAAFNAAIRNVSSRGGGIVHARGKGVYVVKPILLQNHTVLEIAADTYINATHDCPGSGFPTLMLPRPAQCGGPESTAAYPPCGTVLFAANVYNFSVRGGGSIDGGGITFDAPPYTHPRGPLMQFWMSSDAIVEDLQLLNSANVHVSPVFSQRMRFRRLYAYSDFAGPHHKNTDGFNPSSSSDMSLEDSFIHNGDDCIAVKSGKQPAAWSCDIPSENILIKNVTCAGSHGLTIGSEVAGGIRNVTFRDVNIHGADGHPSSGAIKFKLPCGRGAYVKDVLYENVIASNVASGIMLAGAGASCSINGTTIVSNVTIRNVLAQKIAGPAFAIDGYSVEGQPSNYTPFSVTLDNVSMVDYAQVGSCTHATVQASDVNPSVPTKDASCVLSSFSSVQTASATRASNGTTTFVDLWPAPGQTGQYRFPSFISTRKSVLLFVSGPSGVEIRRSTNSGESWSAPWQMKPTIGVAQAMYHPGSDAVYVLHRHPAPVNGTCDQICGRWVSKSTNDGSTWSDPIPAGKGDVGATWGSGLAHGIALRSGRLAAAYRTDCSDRGQPGYHCTDNFFITDRALLSDDSGATWYAGGGVPHAKRSDWTESNLAELANGSVVLTSRMFEHSDNERSWAISHDGAKSWANEWNFSSRQFGGYGPEGNTEGSLIAAKNGTKLLFAHPTTYSLQVGGGRDNLTVSESSDGGFSWTTFAWGLVYRGGSAYSDMALLPNGSIGVAWERGRYQYISFAVLTPPWATSA